MTSTPTRAPILTFLGATGTVTGSRFLVDDAGSRVLVDCGLFQGVKRLRERNWEPFPFDPRSIDAVVLTHAHVDHVGYLPRLERLGFTGPVYATPGTTQLSGIVLPDSAHLQEEEAEYATRKGFSRHHPAQPLYTVSDAASVLERFRVIPFEHPFEVADGVTVTFRRAGHILGSSTVTLTLERSGRTLFVSGDVGRPAHPILCPPAAVPEVDVVLVESTYGNRRHDDEASRERFRDAIVRTARRGGTVVIPAFAVDRTEVVLLELRRLLEADEIPDLPIFVDSPMALAALDVYRKAIARGGAEIRAGFARHRDPFDAGRLTEVRDVAESKALNEQRFPSIVISASGMATGGRVLHHLAHRIGDVRNSVVLVGFQAEGTRGRDLLMGVRHIKMHGRYLPVGAEIVDVPGFSIHADGDELISWLSSAPRSPGTAFVVHGEPEASAVLRGRMEAELGWNSVLPAFGERVRLD
ncbi:MAG TPA: MBL fold metallo-hydrolase [Acidimicrobiales bacterium]|nr:MBL fold metallo-hydrolase [Acidimicrobiales bacterium]